MNRDNAGVIAPPPLIAFAGMVVAFLLNYVLPIRLFPEWFRIAGVGVMAVAMIPALWAVLSMILAGTHPEPSHPTTRIVTWGIFRFTRNPIYLSYTLFLIGLALFTRSIWMLAAAVVVWAVLHYGVILREERYLERKFGDTYLDYKRRVRRWL